MKNNANIIYTVLFVFLSNLQIQAQKWSIPYITNYSPKTYDAGSDNWSILQDKRGVMYFANSAGLMQYDGTRWELFPVKNTSIVRSLAIDENGKIYAGAVGDFGYFKANKSGRLEYVSLVDSLNESDKSFAEVWKTYIIGNTVYFQTFDKVFAYENGHIEVILPENIFHLSFKVNDEIWIIDRGIGLKKIYNKKISKLKNGDAFLNDKIYAVLPYNQKTYLVATFNDNLQLFNPFTDNKDSILIKFNTNAEEYFNQTGIYNGIVLDPHTFAIGTLGGGIVILDKSGSVKNVLCKSNGMQDEAVYYQYLDNQKNLWVGLSKGISKIEYNSPIAWYTDVSGLNGKIQSIIQFNHKIYVATSQGLYYQKTYNDEQKINSKADVENYINRFESIPQIVSQCWALLKTNQKGKDDKLYVASNSGIYQLDTQNNIKKISDLYTYSLHISNLNPNILYAGTARGLVVLKFENSQWTEKGLIDGISAGVRSIAEDKSGDIWLGIPFEGVTRVKINHDNSKNPYTVQKFDSTSGLTDFRYDVVFKIDNDILVGTYIGLFKWNFEKNKFEREKRFGEKLSDGNRQVYFFTKGFDSTYWYFSANDKVKEAGVVTLKNNIPYIYETPFKRFSGGQINYIFQSPDKRVWLGGPDGLIVFNTKTKVDFEKPFYNIISKIIIGKDSVLFGGNFVSSNGVILTGQTSENINKHEYKFNSFTFEFSSLSFENEKGNRYKWFLQGYDKDWTNYSSETKVSYTNLPEGNYIFRLVSKNIYDIESIETTYEFVILPPWYRTVYAYLGYFVLLFGFVYGAIQLSVYRLKRSKAQLEQIVKERTAEIVKQKEQIEIQKVLVEEKNKDITDSINYASRIQQAILPLIDDVKKVFPESFIFYKPRDIVSGDFYWFAKKGNDVYIAAADCTGHGVPGAFMSMIGHTLLNEILNEKNITDTGKILTELHTQIRKSLKQDQQESRDGMDIALCKINVKTLNVQFSGAMRPLYIISNNELIEIKPDKYPIGGLQDNDEKREFKSHDVLLKKSDLIYLFSDGFADQFGGKDGKKFMVKRLKELLLRLSPFDMNYQYNELVRNYMEWLGDGEQIDDILFIGIRL